MCVCIYFLQHMVCREPIPYVCACERGYLNRVGYIVFDLVYAG